MPPTKTLSSTQKAKIAERLSQAIINKETPHPADMARAAVILYDVMNMGYEMTDWTIEEILKSKRYSETLIEHLQEMVNSFSYLREGKQDAYYSKSHVTEEILGE